ncbi:hypothetical protein VNO78_01447 [Psophocarpus tetragonolobus]|uniref:Uncharacterized protein n=1 Tax=Psophocarpus tetragonolobus TaxID=3891 RepID=A0AAN9SYC2_PSOTE
MAWQRKGQSVDRNPNSNTNGVVITTYTESVITRSRKLSEDPTQKTKQGTHRYHRRAFLLARSRELRNAGSQKVPLPTNNSWPKTITKLKLKSMEKRELGNLKTRMGANTDCIVSIIPSRQIPNVRIFYGCVG